jgi:hypothetical protein
MPGPLLRRCLALVFALALSPMLPAAPAPADDAVARAAAAIVERHGDAAILVVGELHGTQEAPAVLAALVRTLGARSAVQVGLEIPAEEQPALDAWLASDGGAAARTALLAGRFWQQPEARSDGRRSQAMLALLDDLRRLHATHPTLRLLAYDAVGGADVTRDQAMAQALRRAHRAAPQTQLLVLTGNYHARLAPPKYVSAIGVPLQPPAPMAGLLAGLPLVTVDLGARRGRFWACQGECGIQTLQPRWPHDGSVTIEEFGPAPDDYHLRVWLPEYTPSRPVRP